MIKAQILFAMIRYPIVHQIIQECAEKYEKLNEKFGEDARNITLDHVIEINSGN